MSWYVVDTITGVRFEPGRDTYAEAVRDLIDRSTAHDDDVPGRFDVIQEAATPWAYAVPMQETIR